RRPRSPEEAAVFLGHSLQVVGTRRPVRGTWESDRARFLGRGRAVGSPAALAPGSQLSGTTGNVLDPCMAFRREVTIPAGGAVRLIGMLAAGPTRDRVLTALHLEPGAVERDIAGAEGRCRNLMRDLGITAGWRAGLPRLARALLCGAPQCQAGAPLPLARRLAPGPRA